MSTKRKPRIVINRPLQPGDRVLVVADHPWAGHSGTYVGNETTLVGPMFKVQLDNGLGCFAQRYQLMGPAATVTT